MKREEICIGNPVFGIYLLYIIFIVFVEWIYFLLKILDVHGPAGAVEVIVGATGLLLLFFSRGFWHFEKIPVKWEMIAGVIAILLYGIWTSSYPDRGFDTFNYHLIAQNPLFENYFIDDYGYGNFQVWGFRLADRLFYYFRLLLGFRLGTFFNSIVACVCYVQIYSFLLKIEEKYKHTNTVLFNILHNKLLWGLLILFSRDSLMMFGTYYVDIVAIPIAMEVISRVLEEKKKSTIDIVYFALLNGVWLGLKLTNIVYVIVCVLLYIMINRKQLRISTWIYSAVAFLVPYLHYLVFDFICTGNPVFPYYNSIFKSPYFDTYNFSDTRFGGQNIFEKMFWIAFAAIKPNYRQSEIPDRFASTIIMGLITIFVVIVLKKIHRKNFSIPIEIKYLSIISLASGLAWGWTTGISRYYIFGRVLLGIVTYIGLIIISNSFNRLGKIQSVLFGAIGICAFALNIYSVTASGVNWKWTNYQLSDFSGNIRTIIDSRRKMDDVYIIPETFAITNPEMMGVAELINSDAYVVYLNYAYGNDCLNEILDRITMEKEVYDLHSRAWIDAEDYVDELNIRGLYIKEIKTHLIEGTSYQIIELNKDVKNNSIWESGGDPLYIDVDSNTREIKLTFIAGREYDWGASPKAVVSVFKVNNEQLVYYTEIEIDNAEYRTFDVPLEWGTGDEAVCIMAKYENGDDLTDEINKVLLFNAEVNP